MECKSLLKGNHDANEFFDEFFELTSIPTISTDELIGASNSDENYMSELLKDLTFTSSGETGDDKNCFINESSPTSKYKMISNSQENEILRSQEAFLRCELEVIESDYEELLLSTSKRHGYFDSTKGLHRKQPYNGSKLTNIGGAGGFDKYSGPNECDSPTSTSKNYDGEYGSDKENDHLVKSNTKKSSKNPSREKDKQYNRLTNKSSSKKLHSYTKAEQLQQYDLELSQLHEEMGTLCNEVIAHQRTRLVLEQNTEELSVMKAEMHELVNFSEAAIQREANFVERCAELEEELDELKILKEKAALADEYLQKIEALTLEVESANFTMKFLREDLANRVNIEDKLIQAEEEIKQLRSGSSERIPLSDEAVMNHSTLQNALKRCAELEEELETMKNSSDTCKNEQGAQKLNIRHEMKSLDATSKSKPISELHEVDAQSIFHQNPSTRISEPEIKQHSTNNTENMLGNSCLELELKSSCSNNSSVNASSNFVSNATICQDISRVTSTESCPESDFMCIPLANPLSEESILKLDSESSENDSTAIDYTVNGNETKLVDCSSRSTPIGGVLEIEVEPDGAYESPLNSLSRAFSSISFCEDVDEQSRIGKILPLFQILLFVKIFINASNTTICEDIRKLAYGENSPESDLMCMSKSHTLCEESPIEMDKDSSELRHSNNKLGNIPRDVEGTPVTNKLDRNTDSSYKDDFNSKSPRLEIPTEKLTTNKISSKEEDVTESRTNNNRIEYDIAEDNYIFKNTEISSSININGTGKNDGQVDLLKNALREVVEKLSQETRRRKELEAELLDFKRVEQAGNNIQERGQYSNIDTIDNHNMLNAEKGANFDRMENEINNLRKLLKEKETAFEEEKIKHMNMIEKCSSLTEQNMSLRNSLRHFNFYKSQASIAYEYKASIENLAENLSSYSNIRDEVYQVERRKELLLPFIMLGMKLDKLKDENVDITDEDIDGKSFINDNLEPSPERIEKEQDLPQTQAIIDEYKQKIQSLENEIEKNVEIIKRAKSNEVELKKLKGEVSLLHRTKERLLETKSHLSSLKEKVENMSLIGVMLDKAVSKCHRLEGELSKLQSVQLQMDQYKARATTAEARLCEVENELQSYALVKTS